MAGWSEGDYKARSKTFEEKQGQDQGRRKNLSSCDEWYENFIIIFQSCCNRNTNRNVYFIFLYFLGMHIDDYDPAVEKPAVDYIEPAASKNIQSIVSNLSDTVFGPSLNSNLGATGMMSSLSRAMASSFEAENQASEPNPPEEEESFFQNIIGSGATNWRSILKNMPKAERDNNIIPRKHRGNNTIAPDIIDALMDDERAHAKRSATEALAPTTKNSLRSRKANKNLVVKKLRTDESEEGQFVGVKNN